MEQVLRELNSTLEVVTTPETREVLLQQKAKLEAAIADKHKKDVEASILNQHLVDKGWK